MQTEKIIVDLGAGEGLKITGPASVKVEATEIAKAAAGKGGGAKSIAAAKAVGAKAAAGKGSLAMSAGAKTGGAIWTAKGLGLGLGLGAWGPVVVVAAAAAAVYGCVKFWKARQAGEVLEGETPA